jgi:probable H4MPT-linked C1 transfer pathway protein
MSPNFGFRGTSSARKTVSILGWDIGGSNTKVCRVENGRAVQALSRPFEVKDAPDRLPSLLQALAAEAAGDGAVDANAVTMTAELSRVFLTKREGVASVLDALESALGDTPVHVFTVDGVFMSPAAARQHPLDVAAANWMATALLAARTHANALLVDIGTTTTDVIPIVDGVVAADGRTDPDRLATGELLYTGAVRTPVEALAAGVCVHGRHFTLAAECFATAADVHVWRGDLWADDVKGATADGRPASRDAAGHRLARALCSDRELMDEPAIGALADALASAQVERVAGTIARVAARHPSIRHAVVAGVGAFIAERAVRAAGLEVVALADALGSGASRCAPAAAVALLLEERLAIRTVVKLGGSLLAHDAALTAVLDRLDGAAGTLVVPGGGPFANAVRDSYARGEVGDDAAHWLAVRAMDQYADVLASRMPRGVCVTGLADAGRAIAAGCVPILAPSSWLRETDPLPHSWDVTSDSIAAWVAGQAGASTLVLVKAPGASGNLVDAYFERALPAGITSRIVTADQFRAV